MMKNNSRLLTLLKDKKITQDEYQKLSNALEKTPASNTIFGLLINPYQRIAGLWALILGFGIIAIISYLATIAQTYFPGIVSVLNAMAVQNAEVGTDFQLLLYQNIVGWGVLSVLFILTAIICQQKRIRWIDFMGTVALARFPYILLLAFIATIRVMYPSFLAIKDGAIFTQELSMGTFLFGAVVTTCIIWQIVTYFFALKESSGLQGKKLWGGFIACIVIGELIAGYLTMMPVLS